MMNTNFKIVFGKSSSSNYERVQALAKKFHSFQRANEERDQNLIRITHSDEMRDRLEQIRTIWELTRSWKSVQFILNDKVLSTKELWDIFRIQECASKYHSAVIPEKYCRQYGEREGWGCKHQSAIECQIAEVYFNPRTNYWYQFGHFANDKLWIIEKDKLREAILREIAQKWINICPVFDLDKTENIIRSLPDQISLDNDSEWKVVYEEFASSTKVEKKPVSIRHETTRISSSSSGGISSVISIKMPKFDEDQEETEKGATRNIPDTSFSDIGGIEEILETVREVIELPLIKPEIFKSMGIKPHKGILLYGPPGCGKTMIAKAIANEIKAHFILISGPELLSKWYGESEGNLRKVFIEARQLQPSVVYWDEIDSLTQKRSAEEGLRLESRIVNQLLTLMDGVEQYGNICIIASTNRKELIDEALLRPGRFDYCIEIKKPSEEACFQIFSIAIRDMPIDKKFGIKKFCAKLYGLNGAEIVFIAREGAYNCLRRSLNLKKIIKEQAFDQYDLKELIITEEDFQLALNKMREYDGSKK